jgi:hypothetical protein
MPDPVDSDAIAAEASLVAALSVYLEPIAENARVLVVGDVDRELSTRIEELGARSVHRLEAGLEVRDGAFDVAVVPDLNALDDIAGTLSRLRRVVDARGAVIALGRARTEAREVTEGGFPDLAPAMLGYAELYDQFALRFEHVAMTGVVPFRGVVFAELGHEESDVGVSVDTRLVDAPPPDVLERSVAAPPGACAAAEVPSAERAEIARIRARIKGRGVARSAWPSTRTSAWGRHPASRRRQPTSRNPPRKP